MVFLNPVFGHDGCYLVMRMPLRREPDNEPSRENTTREGNVRRTAACRNQLIGVLVRPPCSGGEQHAWADLVIDPIEQIEELADLRHRGLLTAEEFERQKAKVIRP